MLSRVLLLLFLLLLAFGLLPVLYSLSGSSSSLTTPTSLAQDYEVLPPPPPLPSSPSLPALVPPLPQVLVNLRKRGLPLCDYPFSPIWNTSALIPDWEMYLFAHIGPTSRTCSANAKRPKVLKIIFKPYGFGSNIFNLIYNILYSARTRVPLALVSKVDMISHKPKFANDDWTVVSSLDMDFESHFAFAQVGETLCPSFTKSCAGQISNCLGIAVHGRPAFLFKESPQLDAFKMVLSRELTRLRPELHTAVTFRFNDLWGNQSVDDDEKDSAVSIAFHVRRGDKLLLLSSVREPEAKILPIETYLDAAQMGLAGRKVRKVFVVTDDGAVPNAFEKAWASRGWDKVEFVLRVAVERPDQAVVDWRKREGAFSPTLVDLLADLRLFVSADVFVGTGSSNMGDLTYFLRGGVSCMDAENEPSGFAWLQNTRGAFVPDRGKHGK